MQKSKIGYRPTWAEVNLDNLAYNFRQIKHKFPRKTKITVCVKADAYGHGLLPVAKRLVSCGVDCLSVASIDEGIKLRKAGIKIPILILGMILKKDIAPLFKYNLTQTVCTEELAVALNSAGRLRKKVVKVHIKVDTGMGRLGVLHHDALEFVKKAVSLKYIKVEGIFTHLACADTNRKFTAYQVEIFDDLISELEERGIKIPLVHAANSLGITSYNRSHFNMVRPGLIVYGLYPHKNIRIKLKPVLSLKTRVVYIKEVPKGWGISYGHIYVTDKKTSILTLPIGYGDGYPRNLSNVGPALIQGRRFKISGRVCMDQVMVDVGDFKAEVGDEVILIGSQGEGSITTEEIADLAGTIPYEIVCGLGSRVPRIYLP